MYNYMCVLQEPTVAFSYVSRPVLTGEDEDVYLYGDLKTDPNAEWKVSRDIITPGEVISEGKFAVVANATLRDKSGTREVIAKTAKGIHTAPHG